MQHLNRREFGGLLLALAQRPASASKSGIDTTLRTGIAQRKIPAAVGMAATPDKILYAGAFGTRDSSGVPVKPDSIFQIASMTKAVTTVAALQLVDQGKVKLEEPVSKFLPKLANLEVLQGFDDAGKPILRPAKTPVTLKHLLTHTSGFCYDIWDGAMFRYGKQVNGKLPAVPPLMFEPGTRWQYGTGCDWAGRLVEAVSDMSLEDYFQARILKPLEMADTSYILPPAKFDRLVATYNRQDDGSLHEVERVQPNPPAQFNGGGGLYSTAPDYIRFTQMILRKGAGPGGVRILQPATVASMEVNQIGASTAGKMRSFRPDRSSDVDIQPGATEKWGLGFLINTTAYHGGRSAGSLAWAGLYNTFYWIDPKRSRCAVLLMQFLPFVDREAVGLLGVLSAPSTNPDLTHLRSPSLTKGTGGRMKNLYLSLALVLSVSALPALEPKQSLNCDQHHGDSRRANFCEMREQTVSAAGGIISVDGRPNGGITVKGWDRSDVLVRSQVRTSAATDAEARDLARQVNVQTAGAQIRADGPKNDRDRSWSVSYEVFVPTRSSANLQSTNGGISVSDVVGTLEFKAVNGGVTLKRVGGNVQGQTTNGGVHIELAGDRWDGHGLDVKTTNGGVTLTVPQRFSAQLEAQTLNGGIHSDTPMVLPVSNRPERRVSTTLGSGGATLRLTTTNGGVAIKHI